MKIMVLTSELWPVFSGGLGVAVYELIKSFNENQSHVKFLVGIPRLNWKGDLDAKIIEAPARLGYSVYFHNGEPILCWESMKQIYGFNFSLFKACEHEDFDIIHANDWMTIPAGIMLKEKGHPLVFHVHSTEFDRTNNNPRQWVVEMEKLGAKKADLVIANSEKTKRQLIEVYGIDGNKIQVIYNGINVDRFKNGPVKPIRKSRDKVVLFVGRLTIQKGVWHLLHAARLVVNKDPKIKFVIVGDGPDKNYLISLAVKLGLEKHVIFTGKVSDDELLAAYKSSDLFVMPSVSEPFGIVALEAIASGKPAIISKTSGVSEIMNHCFKVDYWDTTLTASRIMETLHYAEVKRALEKNGRNEVNRFTWSEISSQFEKTYRRLLHA